ncbi:endolytic transglycosylase MltG [Rhodobacteraceae bacterium WD3A24]|nr:endolytic transglycosylase MltG [Rhodobacteraceae bacterium WD3A24]
MWRNVASNALTLGVVILALIAGLLAWAQHEFTRPGPLESAICLRVAQGATLREVSEQLDAQGAVTMPQLLRAGARYTDRADDLRFGSYLVPEGASMEEIIDIVTRGGQSTCGTEVNLRIGIASAEIEVREFDPGREEFVEIASLEAGAAEPPDAYQRVTDLPDTRYRVTLAEGVTSWQVTEALRAAGFLSGEIAEVPAEGSLAPQSYEVTRGASRADLIAEMQARQERLLAELWEARDEGLPLETPEEALILASIIEKETAVADERREVASVFVNRLERPMRLQTDPTVIYGITGGRETLDRGLRQSELRQPTPYNTYVIDGLPPTPIANPGRASIAAALDPAETDYLYFVADGSGGHAFAATLVEHNENVARWRAIEAERGAQ